MKNIKIVYLFVFALLSFTSCVKDNSNDEFNELNKINIEGLKDRYTVTLQDKLEINPTITSDDDDLSYLWYIYSRILGSKKDTIAHTKDISITITGDIVFPGTEHKLVLRVTDNKTGVYVSEERGIYSQSEYNNGVLMLCETDGKRDLNMLSSDNRMLNNIYSKNNNGELLSDEFRSVQFVNPIPSNIHQKQIFLFADNYSGGVILDPTTLVKTDDVRGMFDGEISDPILSVRDYALRDMNNNISAVDYIIVNDKLHKRSVQQGTLLFQSTPLIISNSTRDFKIQNYVLNTYDPLVYDEANGTILAHATYNKGSLKKSIDGDWSSNEFDPNDIGNYSLVSSGTNGREGDWMLMREKTTNELTLFKIECYIDRGGMDKFICNAGAKIEVNSAMAPNLHNADYFVPMVDLNGFCMYVSGNEIYALNVSKLTSGTSTSQEIELASFDANYSVNKVFYSVVSVPDPLNPNSTRRCNQIRLLVQDNSLSELKGGLLIYEIINYGGLHATEFSKNVGGFCDKIIDITEKDN